MLRQIARGVRQCRAVGRARPAAAAAAASPRRRRWCTTHAAASGASRVYGEGGLEVLPASWKEAKVGRVKKDGSTPRFFKKVTVIQREDGAGWEVELDGRYALLSSGRHQRLTLPTPQLAAAIALDWDHMHTVVDLRRMPMYTLSSVAVDADEEQRAKMRNVIVSILDTDNVCCRPDNDNADVLALQRQYQDPLIHWFQQTLAVPLHVSTSFETTQPPVTLQRIRAFVDSLDPWQLAGLYSLTEACLSLVTALALSQRVITVEDALRATRLELIPFERKWGDVPGSTDMRRAEVNMDIATAAAFLSLLHPLPLPTAPTSVAPSSS